MPAPAERQSLASLVGDFDRLGSQVAVVASRGLRQRKTSYGELAILARRMAAELVDRRIGKGERVLLWGENSAEWIAAFFGCVWRGVLPVPLDAASTPEFAARIIKDVTPRLIVAGQTQLDSAVLPGPVLPLDELGRVLTRREEAEMAVLSPENPLQIIFTSGTTGEPKGVVHTHANVLASLLPIEREMQKYLKFERPFHPIRILHTLPLSHVFGQFMGLWIPAPLTGELHFQARLVAPELIEQIRRERISVLAAVPRVLDLLQDQLVRTVPDLTAQVTAARTWNVWKRWWHFREIHRQFGWKFWAFVCGGASLPAEAEQFWSALGFLVVQGYGMTETTALVSLNHPFHATAGTLGQVLPGREVRLSSDGEVLVRGQTIATASWQNGQLQPDTDEWLATGDLGEFDVAGNLRFRGRKKDVIVTSSGLNIHPEDLEGALLAQTGVHAATVVESMTELGPEPLSVLVMQGDADPQGAVAGANRQLAEFQQIRRWLVWPEPDLPRTSTGKTLRREVARRIASGEVGTESSAGEEGEQELDSLGRVQLQAQLEQQYGVALADRDLETARTAGEVRQRIRETPSAVEPAPRAGREHLYPRWVWSGWQQAIRSVFLEVIAFPLVRFLASPLVVREAQIPPSETLLIVANHITTYDGALVLFALPAPLRRRVAIAMSGEMLLDLRRGRNQGHWFLNWLAPAAYFLITALFNVFPLPQRSGFRRSFRHAGEAMDHGYSVLVFPEGRRSDDGAPQPFKSGAGLLWKELGVRALPVYLSGLGEIKARGGKWFRSGKIQVRVGQVLTAEQNEDPTMLAERLREGVFGAITGK